MKTSIKLCFLTFTLWSCTTPSPDHNNNRLKSIGISERQERIATLKEEIKVFSNIDDAEFDLFNVNGFSTSRMTVPGTSSIDYKFALKIDPMDVHKWTTGMTRIDLPAQLPEWPGVIIERRQGNWKINSEPKYYRRNGADVEMLIYENEGIIFKRVMSN